MDDSAGGGAHDGYSLRDLSAAATGFAPSTAAGTRRVILRGRRFTLDDEFVPLADYEALREECRRLRAGLNGQRVTT